MRRSDPPVHYLAVHRLVLRTEATQHQVVERRTQSRQLSQRVELACGAERRRIREVAVVMTEQIYCPAQTYPQTRDNPAEYCEELVSDYGDFCPRHEECDRSDAVYDDYLESMRNE